ncbi:hypothetical protein [Pedobacter sp. MW01-1-1]|uniref:hypothetical protein n=1 Tax=Pedobacter sp. MW01-1-1 TaxID=3383027 RepID=UPI003FF0F96F
MEKQFSKHLGYIEIILKTMKNKLLTSIVIILPFAFACNQHSENKAASKANSLVQKKCYVATFETDTAQMSVETMASEKVMGSLTINYGNGNKNIGTFEGKFSGDTLLVEYRFKEGADTTTVYANPLAFLQKKDTLIMGVGQIETTMGRSYFVKGKPINYERGKFTFVEKNCVGE